MRFTQVREKKTPEVLQEIDKIKSRMNSKRSDFSGMRTRSSEIRITPYWVLGFVEGEGSFSCSKINYTSFAFSVGQSFQNLALMEALKDFFNHLALTSIGRDFGDVAGLSHHKTNDMIYLNITRLDYIKSVLIPFLDGMTWQSKKVKDYQDWIAIIKLKELGLHYTEEGQKLILVILSQMNNNRLSTSRSPVVDRALLLEEIEKFLKGPSNLEEREDGRIFIKSLNKYYSDRAKIRVELQDEKGNVINTFDSQADCAKYLGVSPPIVAKRIRNSIPTSLENKLVYIKKVEN